MGTVDVRVVRSSGARGTVRLPYCTVDGTGARRRRALRGTRMGEASKFSDDDHVSARAPPPPRGRAGRPRAGRGQAGTRSARGRGLEVGGRELAWPERGRGLRVGGSSRGEVLERAPQAGMVRICPQWIPGFDL